MVCTLSDCNVSLGMQSGAIPNASITASSYYNSGHEPFRARLYNQAAQLYKVTVDTGSWSSKTLKAGEYLQVDLGRTTWVTMVATQGRPSYDQWITSYSVSYSLDGVNYQTYKEPLSEDVKVTFK